MATVYISEHEDYGQVTQSGIIPAATLTAHIVSVTATASLSSAFSSAARVIRIHTDTVCSVSFGTAPSATASSPRMAGGQTEYFFLPATTNTTFRISTITNS